MAARRKVKSHGGHGAGKGKDYMKAMGKTCNEASNENVAKNVNGKQLPRKQTMPRKQMASSGKITKKRSYRYHPGSR